MYWYIVADGACLKVCIEQRDSHFSGQQVEVTGRLSRALRRWSGDFELLLTVTGMTPIGEPTEDWMRPLRAIGTRRQGEWPTVAQTIEQRIRAGNRPRVLQILGTGAGVGSDVYKALGTHAEAHHLTEQRVSMINPVAIAKAVTTPRGVDLIALVGGGGDWLSAYSDRHFCTAVAETAGVPIVSAVGHEGNHLLVKAVVHQAFATPSLFGIWLKERAVAAIDETAQQVAALEKAREQLEQKLQAEGTTRRLAEAQAQTLQRRQKTYNVAWGVVAGVIIVGLLIMLMAR